MLQPYFRLAFLILIAISVAIEANAELGLHPSVSSPSQQVGKVVAEDNEALRHYILEFIEGNNRARRLLSQLLHPEKQIRERALEWLIRLVDDDTKQRELPRIF